MAFTLRITHGSDTEERSFEGEARLGRTADNDVVIKDPASSRSHARVFEEDEQCFVEDLKSANGTLLNGRAVKAKTLLETGDRLSIGEVSLDFLSVAAAGPSDTLDGEDEPAAVQETILKPPSKPRVAAVPRPRVTGEQPASAPPRKPTGEINAVAPRKPTRPIAVEPVAEPEPAPAEPTAAERARERRELQRSSMGRVQLLWSELPRPTRIAAAVIGSAITLGLLAAVVSALIPKRVAKHAETSELVPNGEPVNESYGLGDVDFAHPDMKSFTVTYPAPTAIVGLLHYQARDCGKDEVSIELNGTPLGSVPPDTTDDRQLEIVLPATQLKPNETNEIVFDNVNNPPAKDSWRISNVSVEVIPVPRLSAEEAAQRARADLQRAAKFYELRAIGAMNLFRAWKQYREAWLLLEATPDRPPELLQTARARMNEIRPELDNRCAAMLLTYQREMNKRRPDLILARQELQDIASYFEKEHPCFNISRGLIGQLEQLEE